MSPVVRRSRPAHRTGRLSSGPRAFIRAFFDSLACLNVAIDPVVGTPDPEEQHGPLRRHGPLGLVVVALMLFALPSIALGIVLPEHLRPLAAFVFAVSLLPAFLIRQRGEELYRRHMAGRYEPRVRWIDLAILVAWNLAWIFAGVSFVLT